MHDDTVRVDDAFAAVVFGALPEAPRGTVALEDPPVAATAAPAYGRTDRCGEAIEQAAQLASWEDEGGTALG